MSDIHTIKSHIQLVTLCCCVVVVVHSYPDPITCHHIYSHSDSNWPEKHDCVSLPSASADHPHVARFEKKRLPSLRGQYVAIMLCIALWANKQMCKCVLFNKWWGFCHEQLRTTPSWIWYFCTTQGRLCVQIRNARGAVCDANMATAHGTFGLFGRWHKRDVVALFVYILRVTQRHGWLQTQTNRQRESWRERARGILNILEMWKTIQPQKHFRYLQCNLIPLAWIARLILAGTVFGEK